MIRNKTLFAAVLALLAATSPAAQIFAVDNLGPNNSGSTGDRVIVFDSANPSVVTLLGATGIANELMSGLDFDASGTLYAYGQTNSRLYRISQSTGAATLVGGGGLQGGDVVTDLAFNYTDGKMYAIGTVQAASRVGLYTINLSSGAATKVAEVTGGQQVLPVGLAISPSGAIYFHDLLGDKMYQINGSSYAPKASQVGYTANFSQGMTFDPNSGTWYLGAFDTGWPASQLWTIDESTGVGTSVGNIGGQNANGLPEYEPGDIAILKTAGPTDVPPSSFSVFRGALEAGDLSSLFASDDNYLQVRNGPVALPSEAPITITFDAVSPNSTLASLSLSVENRVSINNLTQQIDLFDFAANGYDQLDQRPAPTTDTVVTIVGTNVNRYIEPGTNALRARLRIRPGGVLFTNAWRTFVDRVVWTVQ